MAILESTFYGNTVSVWAIAAAIAVSVFFALMISKAVLVSRLSALAEKTTTQVDDIAVDLLRRTKFFFVLVAALYLGMLVLILPEKAAVVVTKAFVIAFLAQAAIWGDALIAHLIKSLVQKKAREDAAAVATVSMLGFIARVIVWSGLVLLALDNLGFNITALVAGLGIGGIAVALAAQNVLSDVFASLSIDLGTVEHIGMKSTLVRSLSGEQLVFSNNDLLNSRIRNYKRMFERRIVFSFGVVYQTPYEKVAAIPSMLREIIESQDQTRFDRGHFKSYGDFSLNFEVVYYVKVPDYNVYMDIQQAINLAIFKRFEQEGIAFAYPTQTLYLEKG
jgi:small-conductance mechanosensitive channel